MSDKKDNYSVGYDMDNEEYRALFQRIENSSRKFADSRAERTEEKREYRDETVTPQAQKDEKLNLSNLTQLMGAAKKQFNSGKKKIQNRPNKKLPFLTRLYKVSVVMFASVLMLFGLISAVDKNKTVSEQENRALAEKPKFTFASLFKGDYTVAFENFYSDNFPARDFFISCNSRISDLFTRFSGENGEVVVATEKKDGDFVGEGVDLLGEKKPEGMKENTAAVTPDSEASISGSILITGTRALEIYSHSEDNAKNYASIINKTAKSMPEDVKFYSMLCPTAVEFYGTAKYREGSHSQRDAIKQIYSQLDESIVKIDVYSNLVDNVGDYIYFRSDHHWTARGAYCGYKAFCDASGNSAPALDSFTTHRLEGFLGSLYKSTYSNVLRDNPDYVECFELSVDAQNMVYPSAELNMSEGVSTYVIARIVNDDNKYLAFIAGDQPIEKITTSVRNGKKILIIKESYGNAFVPFLCNNYEEIYVVDPRWIDMNLADFVTANGIQEVMAINYMFAISNKTYCNALSKMSDRPEGSTQMQSTTQAPQETAQAAQSYNEEQ